METALEGQRVALEALADDQKTRHGLLLTELQKQWSDPKVLNATLRLGPLTRDGLSAVVKATWDMNTGKPSRRQRRTWHEVSPLANFLEYMGVLVTEKILTKEMIYNTLGAAIIQSWATWEPSAKALRIYDDEPDTFVNFQKLAEAMQQISDERRSQPTSAAVPPEKRE